jgi:hypothetical protein
MVSIEEVFKDKQNHKYIKSERDEKRVCGRAIYFVSFLTKKTIFFAATQICWYVPSFVSIWQVASFIAHNAATGKTKREKLKSKWIKNLILLPKNIFWGNIKVIR